MMISLSAIVVLAREKSAIVFSLTDLFDFRKSMLRMGNLETETIDSINCY